MMPVITANTIEQEVKLQYGVDIKLVPLMWPADNVNSCCKRLCFDDETVASWENVTYYNEWVCREHLLVYSILRDIFPEDIRTVLIDID